MSREAVAQVVQRSLSDPAFRRRITTDPTALGGFDLTTDETTALRSGDAAKLSSFGIDQRMSKLFTLDPGTGSASIVSAGSSEPRDAEPWWAGSGSEAVTGNSVEPRDVEPWDAGSATDALDAGQAVEPHDVEPTDISGTLGGDSELKF